MAWIESHQELRTSPKVARLAQMLGVSVFDALGRLHALWWWALDYADDGDLSDFDAADIAIACGWDDDPERLVKALCECGPGTKAGFVDELEGRWVLHDWWEYAGKLVARRESDRQRKRAERGSGAVRGKSSEPQPKSKGRPKDVQRSGVRTVPNPTQPNPTSSSDRRADVDRLCDLLASLVEGNGAQAKVNANWRVEARRLLDLDKRDPDEAERVMRWALADSFWRSNVLSMPKFREKYDQLRLKMTANLGVDDDSEDMKL